MSEDAGYTPEERFPSKLLSSWIVSASATAADDTGTVSVSSTGPDRSINIVTLVVSTSALHRCGCSSVRHVGKIACCQLWQRRLLACVHTLASTSNGSCHHLLTERGRNLSSARRDTVPRLIIHVTDIPLTQRARRWACKDRVVAAMLGIHDARS